jgi:hypothetical protein
MSDCEKYTGGCLCGAIRYEISEAPIAAGTCHCRECQKWTDGPMTGAVRFTRAALRFISGKPKTFQSTAIAERYFCADCGSPIMLHYLVPPYGPEDVFIKIGTLDNPEAVMGPQFHFGIEGHLSKWVPLDDNLPRVSCEEDPGLMEALSTVR